MSATTLQDLFVHELQDLHYAEQTLVDALDEMATQADDEDVARAFRDHRDETRTHVDRLERVFEMIDETPADEECEGIEGLLEEHESFAREDPDQRVLDLHSLIDAQKVEHYEIAAYGNLAVIADRMDVTEAGDVLHETLEEEKAALDRLATLTENFDFGRIRSGAAAD